MASNCLLNRLGTVGLKSAVCLMLKGRTNKNLLKTDLTWDPNARLFGSPKDCGHFPIHTKITHGSDARTGCVSGPGTFTGLEANIRPLTGAKGA